MLTFTKDLETGVEKIDTQHKELVDRINKLVETREKPVSKGETQKIIDYLGDYVVKHFGDEEVLQVEHKYPKYPEHKEKHRLFVADFLKLKQEFADKGDSLEFTQKLNNSVINWVIRHIKGDDVELGKFIRANS